MKYNLLLATRRGHFWARSLLGERPARRPPASSAHMLFCRLNKLCSTRRGFEERKHLKINNFDIGLLQTLRKDAWVGKHVVDTGWRAWDERPKGVFSRHPDFHNNSGSNSCSGCCCCLITLVDNKNRFPATSFPQPRTLPTPLPRPVHIGAYRVHTISTERSIYLPKKRRERERSRERVELGG